MAGAWGLEFERDRMGLCQVRQTSQGLKLQRGASAPLPAGLLTPSLTQLNVAEEQELTSQLRSLVKKTGWRGGRVVISLPDLTCRIGHQDFEELKGRDADIRQLLSWRLKDHLPFPVQEVRVDYQPLPSNGKGMRLLYLLGREAVLGQYETVLAHVGLEPTRIITRGLALYRCVHIAGVVGKRLFLGLGPSSLSLIYVQDGVPRLWRVLPWDDPPPPDGNRRAARLLRELQETMHYLEEELAVGAFDSLLMIGGEEALADALRKACTFPVQTFEGAGHGLSVDLLAAAGAALLH